ncbi:MAG TPA: hypothetical protein VF097_02795 [Actinomycetota bacterium]
MSRYGALVEREMARIAPPSFSLEDLSRLRARRQRRQRVAARAVALLVAAVAVGLGIALTRVLSPGEGQPAGPRPQTRVFAPADLETVLLGPDETPAGAPHRRTATGRSAIEAPLKNASKLSIPDLMGPGTGFVGARTVEFLRDFQGVPDSLFFASVGVVYDDAESAGRALLLLVEDFQGRAADASREPVASLGMQAFVVRGTSMIKPPSSTDVVYIWRIENLVLLAAGGDSVGRGAPEEARLVAHEMHARAMEAGAGRPGALGGAG